LQIHCSPLFRFSRTIACIGVEFARVYDGGDAAAENGL